MVKVAVVVLVLLLVILGIPLGMPMTGDMTCPECTPTGGWGGMCLVVLASVFLLLHLSSRRLRLGGALRPVGVWAEVLERPPQLVA
jgi:hypothetical protein